MNRRIVASIIFVDETTRSAFKDDEASEFTDADFDRKEAVDFESDPTGNAVKGRRIDLVFKEAAKADKAFDKLAKHLDKVSATGMISIHDCTHDLPESQWKPCTTTNYKEVTA